MQQHIAACLKDAQSTTMMLTTFQECDMGNIMELCAKYKEAFQKKHGIKLRFMSAFVAQGHNGSSARDPHCQWIYIDDTTTEIVYHEYVKISVAIMSPMGLVVPILCNSKDDVICKC
jgi:2-oxoglutarate dehydrogenase E2 component (dihydrolipoamide succinyltransferase)